MSLKRRQYDQNDSHSLATWAHERLDKLDLSKLVKTAKAEPTNEHNSHP